MFSDTQEQDCFIDHSIEMRLKTVAFCSVVFFCISLHLVKRDTWKGQRVHLSVDIGASVYRLLLGIRLV